MDKQQPQEAADQFIADKIKQISSITYKMEMIKRIMILKTARAEKQTDNWKKMFLITECLELHAHFGALKMEGCIIASMPVPKNQPVLATVQSGSIEHIITGNRAYELTIIKIPKDE